MLIQIGDQFEHFQIISHMAQGGMSDVYRARDLLNGREVVLKIPNRMMIGDPAQYERFQRELQVMKTLSHLAIQRGVASGQFNRTPYLVTEFIDGKSLRDIIRDKAPMQPDEAIGLIHKIAEGMAYCHANGIIHRDLKPENILVGPDGQPVILDFGLALTPQSHRVTYANFSSTAGTPDYMAPEQIEGQRGDGRTDQYAIGTMLYEMLTGKTPFSGDSTMEVMAQHVQGAIPRLDKECPGLSPQLAAVVTKALQRNADDRYPDLNAFVNALDHPETADISILETGAGPVTVVPFWRTQTFRVIAFTILIMVVIVVIGFAAQSLKGVPH